MLLLYTIAIIAITCITGIDNLLAIITITGYLLFSK